MTAGRLLAAAAIVLPAPAFAEAIVGGAKQPLNLTAIAIFRGEIAVQQRPDLLVTLNIYFILIGF